MFIEVTEYDDRSGGVYGKAMINTDDVLFVDNYDESTKLYRIKLKVDNYSFYVKQDGYDLIKSILINNKETTI